MVDALFRATAFLEDTCLARLELCRTQQQPSLPPEACEESWGRRCAATVQCAPYATKIVRHDDSGLLDLT